VLNQTLPRLMAFQRLHREWRDHLTVAERDFLGWFLDNTVCWGRTTLRVTVRQMAEGTHWLRSSCIPERTLWRIVKALKEKGLLAVKSLRNVTEFAINLFWTPEDPMLRIPKRLQGQETADAEGANVAETPANLADAVRQIGSPYIEEVRKEEAENRAASRRSDLAPPPALPLVRQRTRPVPAEPAAPARPETAREAIQTALDRSKAKTAARLEGKAKPITTATVWRHAWEATYDVPMKMLGQREMGMLSTLRKRVEQGGVKWNEFLHWAVAEWRETMAEKFDWMTRSGPPSYPAASFLVRFVDHFLDGYAVHLDRERTAAASPEVAEYRKLRASGMRHDDILIEIGKRQAASSGRDELAKEREHVNRMYRVIETERKKLERERLLSGSAPAPTRTTKPVIKHGDNPYEQANPEVVDFSKLNLKWED
jgi:hypothetical protein